MKTKAAVLTGTHRPWEIMELDLEDPRPGEVLVRMDHAGLCHSDKHIQFGYVQYPIAGGHEGAGVVEAVGEGVTRVAVGDHVAVTWIPTCGDCRWCATGRSNLCDLGALMATGRLVKGGYRFSNAEGHVGSQAGVATFAAHSVLDERSVIKIGNEVPLEWASLVSCGVATGWGSVVNAGNVRAGDTVAVYGCGGIGANAVRAAADTGAGLVVVIEPVAWKRDFAKKLGADVAFETAEEAHAEVWDRTGGVGVDVAVVTVGVVDSAVVGAAFNLARKGGAVVLTGVSDNMMENTIELPGSMLTLFSKRIIGTLFGDLNPHADVPRLLGMATSGKLVLDDLVTKRYRLEDINEGFEDMLAGRNIRGMIVHEH